MPGALKLTPTESVTIVRSTPEVLEVEASYGPGRGAPPPHLHPAQDERFEVLSGQLQARVGGAERSLGLGETIDIPRGTVHQMWNPGPEPARVRWETRPGGRTEQWFRSVDRLIRDRAARTDKMPSAVAFATLLSEYRDVFRLATGPDWLLRPAIALLARLGRLRGYGP